MNQNRIDEEIRLKNIALSIQTITNASGQYIEFINSDELKNWLVLHCKDRKIVTVTGIGTGLYGKDDNFLIVSEEI